MKKLVLVLVLIAVLMSFTLTIAWAGSGMEDPIPGTTHNDNGNIPDKAFPGLGHSLDNPGKSGHNWQVPGR